MTATFFHLPDAFEAKVAQAAVVRQITQISNLLLENPMPQLPDTNSTLNDTQIKLLMAAINQHYDQAKTNAERWQSGATSTNQRALKDLVIDTLIKFKRFQKQVDREYPGLIRAAYDKDELKVRSRLERFQGILSILVNETNGTVTAVTNYETELSANQTAFEKDYDRIFDELGKVFEVITNLKSSIARLQQEVTDNNAKVLQTALDTAGTELSQGVAMFTSDATKDAGASVSAGVHMAIGFGDGIEKTLRFNRKSVEDLEKIRELCQQINQDEVVLAALVNIGTMLVSLGGFQGGRLDIIKLIIQYWRGMADGIGNLLENHGDNLSAQIDTVNFHPKTEKYRNPAFPPWDIILPIQKASEVFARVQDVPLRTFGNDTKFVALP